MHVFYTEQPGSKRAECIGFIVQLHSTYVQSHEGSNGQWGRRTVANATKEYWTIRKGERGEKLSFKSLKDMKQSLWGKKGTRSDSCNLLSFCKVTGRAHSQSNSKVTGRAHSQSNSKVRDIKTQEVSQFSEWHSNGNNAVYIKDKRTSPEMTAVDSQLSKLSPKLQLLPLLPPFFFLTSTARNELWSPIFWTSYHLNLGKSISRFYTRNPTLFFHRSFSQPPVLANGILQHW